MREMFITSRSVEWLEREIDSLALENENIIPVIFTAIVRYEEKEESTKDILKKISDLCEEVTDKETLKDIKDYILIVK